MNHNVRVIFALMFVRSMWISLFSNTPLSYYVLLVTGSNTKVGLIQGIQGVVNLATSFPAATLGDRVGKQFVLQVATFVGVLALVATLLTLLLVEKESGTEHGSILYPALLGCMSLWGLFMGLHSATLEAMFGDSVESGKRSSLYSKKAAMNTAGNAIGPALSLVVFAILGDVWSIRNLTVLMAGPGTFAAVVVLGLLLLVREKHTLGRLSESLILQKSSDVTQTDIDITSSVNASSVKEGPFSSSAEENAAHPLHPPKKRCCCNIHAEDIAGIVAVSDLVSALGSGMTVKFFSLWFGEELGVSPMGVLGIMVAGPVGITVFTVAAGKLAKIIGRIQTVLFCKAIGISLLVTLSLTASAVEDGDDRDTDEKDDDLELLGLDDARDDSGEDDDSLPLSTVFLLIGIYLLRTWVMNSTSGLTKSVLNDFVSKKHRAKWNSLESINIFSWSGSAALGGLLVDMYGYRATFLVTAALQATSVMILVPLLALVPVEKFDSRPQPPVDILEQNESDSSNTAARYSLPQLPFTSTYSPLPDGVASQETLR